MNAFDDYEDEDYYSSDYLNSGIFQDWDEKEETVARKKKGRTRVSMSIADAKRVQKNMNTPRTQRRLKLKSKPLLDLFVMALAELYPHDEWSPGITLAWLPKAGKFYGSVCRYNGHPTAQGSKEVLHAVQGDSTLEVIQRLASTWFENNKAASAFAAKVRREG